MSHSHTLFLSLAGKSQLISTSSFKENATSLKRIFFWLQVSTCGEFLWLNYKGLRGQEGTWEVRNGYAEWKCWRFLTAGADKLLLLQSLRHKQESCTSEFLVGFSMGKTAEVLTPWETLWQKDSFTNDLNIEFLGSDTPQWSSKWWFSYQYDLSEWTKRNKPSLLVYNYLGRGQCLPGWMLLKYSICSVFKDRSGLDQGVPNVLCMSWYSQRSAFSQHFLETWGEKSFHYLLFQEVIHDSSKINRTSLIQQNIWIPKAGIADLNNILVR